MLTLRELAEIYKSPSAPVRLKEIAKTLGETPPISLKALLSAYQRAHAAPLKIYQQNMALLAMDGPPLVDSFLYKGTEREKAISRLIQGIRQEAPDVVGLCEVFGNDERASIVARLQDIYGFHLQGPDEDDVEEDGGLLLLSRHPIVAHHQTIYRQCAGEDCLSNKGVLHARIVVPNHPAPYDLFLTHLQNPSPDLPVPDSGPGKTPVDKLFLQLRHLHAFIQANGHPERPALLMGDLNIDGQDVDSNSYQALRTILGDPADLWLTSGEGGQGFTFDEHNSFPASADPLPVDSPRRHQAGERLDYFFSWAATTRLWHPVHTRTAIVNWQSSPGRDMSDHYGLLTVQPGLLLRAVDGTIPIERVTVTLDHFRCLQITGGILGAANVTKDPDEMRFRLRLSTGSGQLAISDFTPEFKEVSSGTRREFEVPVELTVGDPGEFLVIGVDGQEVDDLTPNVEVGPGQLRIMRTTLQLWNGRTVLAAPTLLAGDGGEYVVFVTIGVV